MSIPVCLKGKITENREMGPLYHRLGISLPQSIGPIIPGQFAMLSIEGNRDILLPRPLSIHNFDRYGEASQLYFLFKVVGMGTELLGKLSIGSIVRVLAPLGKGFPEPPSGYEALLIAGGLGIAPLFPLILRLKKSATPLSLFYGAKTHHDLICLPELRTIEGITITIATEDGVSGEKGVVTKLLKHKKAAKKTKTALYACGPEPMLKAVAGFAAQQKMPCWISLERRMACGVGVCLSCVVKTNAGYQCSCSDGPIFASKDIIWPDHAEP
jgi:dihydroorotate dehydrogenase electron transfer subunit